MYTLCLCLLLIYKLRRHMSSGIFKTGRLVPNQTVPREHGTASLSRLLLLQHSKNESRPWPWQQPRRGDVLVTAQTQVGERLPPTRIERFTNRPTPGAWAGGFEIGFDLSWDFDEAIGLYVRIWTYRYFPVLFLLVVVLIVVVSRVLLHMIYGIQARSRHSFSLTGPLMTPIILPGPTVEE